MSRIYAATALLLLASSAWSQSITLRATAGNGQAALSWSYSGIAAGAQEIYRDTDSDPTGRLRIASVSTTTLSYTNTGLTNGQTYWYWIKNTTNGVVTNSNAASVTPIGTTQPPTTGKQVERLDRGVVVIKSSSGVLVSWRLLGTDPSAISFNVYRGTTRLNANPITSSTNYMDVGGTTTATYSVRPVINGVEQTGVGSGATLSNPYLSVPIQRPAGGTSPDGVAYTYEVNDGSVADLNGDGKYEIIVKWQPTNAKDNAQSGYTGNTLIDAYTLTGTRLWRIDLGRNIRAGAHYTTFLAYDFDGDGKAEVMMKTADGTRDGRGVVIGNSSADYRNSSGYILSGPEFITVFNGQTGAIMATSNYIPARGSVSSWGDDYGNRVDRFLGGVAYVDGRRPSAIFSRGYYTRAVIAAWDWRDGRLTNRWTFDTNVAGSAAVGQGAHSFTVGDVNNDGKDDIVYGAATIGSNGVLMYSTGLCHGDALHLGDFNPNRAGLEVFMVHESPSCYGTRGIETHNAATGAILWSVSGEGVDVGRGVCMDINASYAGAECWGSRGGLMSATGAVISSTRPSQMNFGIWWDGDLMRELLDKTLIDKWNAGSQSTSRLLTGYNFDANSNNGTKATPVLSADLFGDWREEVIFRTNAGTSLLIFSTSLSTAYRIPTLMHDPQYRVQIAGQNGGYNQPPHPSFFLGNGMAPVVQKPIYVTP